MQQQPNVGEFCWNELATSDLKATKAFYKAVLGWDFIDHDMGDMTYTMIKKGDNEFGGIWQIPTEKRNEIPPHWMGYILVDNLQETITKAQQNGATIRVPETPVGDFGKFVIVQDPNGAHIAFWQSLKSC